MLRGILVARVSTKEQASDDRFSIEAQFRLMRSCCERREIEIVYERTEPGTSAFTRDLSQLPELHQALLDIENGLANALVMHESSRLARNEQLGSHIIDRLTDCGAKFINASMDIDYTSAEGRSFFNQEVSNNAYQSRKTSEHVKKGKLEQFLQGLPVGRIPFGYRAQTGEDGQPNRKVPPLVVPDEASLIRTAFEERTLGRSSNDIAREWNALGIRSRTGGRFSKQTVGAILTNVFYKGEVTHLGETGAGVQAPIVTEQEWQDAQRPRQRVTRKKIPPLLLQGIAACACCGRALYPSRPPKGPKHPGERYSYYREPSLDFNNECDDAGRIWPSSDADAVIDELIRSLAMSREWLDYVQQEASKLPDEVVAQRSKLEETRRRVQKEYFNQHLVDAEYHRIREELDAELALLPTSRRELTHALEQFESFGDLWVPASAESRNETCRLVFERVLLDMRRKEVVEVRPHPEFEPLFQLRRGLYVSDIRPGRDSR